MTLLVLAMCIPSYAVLGGDEASIKQDQAQMKSSRTIKSQQSYAVHELTAQSGTVVREYISPDGKVFGVAWQGPFMPDLHDLLGNYYDQFSQAARAQREGPMRRRGPVSIQQPGLVVESGGHMRAFFGRAYLPDTLPAGVKAEEIK